MKKILLIEDEQDVLQLIQDKISSDGYQVITAPDAVKGHALAFKEMPDLILVDTKVAAVNSYHFCRMIKFDKSTKHIFVVILSSGTDLAEGQKKAEDVSADGFLQMPCDASELMDVIYSLIG